MAKQKKKRRTAAKTVKLKRGMLVVVRWHDIYEQPCAEENSKIKTFDTVAYFCCWEGRGKDRVLTTTNTRDIEDGTAYGCCSYPAGCVVSIKPIEAAPDGK